MFSDVPLYEFYNCVCSLWDLCFLFMLINGNASEWPITYWSPPDNSRDSEIRAVFIVARKRPSCVYACVKASLTYVSKEKLKF